VLYLMPPAFQDELQLSDVQRKKIQELQEELRQQRRLILVKVFTKVRAILASLEEEGKEEPAPVLAIAHEITGGLLEMRRGRVALEKKMLAVLDAKQREKYAELKERPRQRGRRGSAAAPSSIFSPKVQRRLHLSAEQRRKVADLQHEGEAKARGLLTEEQQRQYEDLTGERRTRKKSQTPHPGSDRGAKPQEQKKREPSK